MLNLQDEIERTQEALRLRQNPFKPHPLIDSWLPQFTPENHGEGEIQNIGIHWTQYGG